MLMLQQARDSIQIEESSSYSKGYSYSVLDTRGICLKFEKKSP